MKAKPGFGERFAAVLLCLSAMLSGVFCSCGTTGETDSNRNTETEEILYRTQDLRVGVGAVLPQAKDFFAVLPEGFRAEYAEEASELHLGEQTVSLRLVAEDGSNRNLTCSACLTLVRDTYPPIMEGVKDFSVVIGDAIAYRKGIELWDDCFGEISLTVDSSAVRQDIEGSYPVLYVATDAAGNRTEQRVYVHVYREAFDEDRLWQLIDGKINEMRCGSKTKEQQCRLIYSYLQNFISYTGDSDKGDWKREAYRTLSEGTGDCFSYFAAAKAFFVRLGIETLDVERSAAVAAAVGERHYWSMVNLSAGDGEAVWYHFDACRLSSAYGYVHSGCLLTDAQLEAYNQVRKNADGVTGYFYAYEKADYPATPKTILTPTPELEPFLK